MLDQCQARPRNVAGYERLSFFFLVFKKMALRTQRVHAAHRNFSHIKTRLLQLNKRGRGEQPWNMNGRSYTCSCFNETPCTSCNYCSINYKDKLCVVSRSVFGPLRVAFLLHLRSSVCAVFILIRHLYNVYLLVDHAALKNQNENHFRTSRHVSSSASKTIWSSHTFSW